MSKPLWLILYEGNSSLKRAIAMKYGFYEDSFLDTLYGPFGVILSSFPNDRRVVEQIDFQLRKDSIY